MPQGRGKARKPKGRRKPRQVAADDFLYHGTTAILAALIETAGLKPGRDGRVYLADSLEMAHRYAGWATAIASTVTGADHVPTGSGVGDRANQLGTHVAAVAYVPRKALGKLAIEKSSTAPPLPWETTWGSGTTYFTTDSVPSAQIDGFQVFRVDELDTFDPAQIRTEADRIARTYQRDNETPGDSAPAAQSPVAVALPKPLDLLTAAYDGYLSDWHGFDHALEVAGAGIRILEAGATADPAVLLAFAVLHDSQRLTEGRDPDHGQRAADFANRTAGTLHHLTGDQLEKLCHALVDHDRGHVSADDTIGACWDADRLTLPRIGITPDPYLISTTEGRALIGAVTLPKAKATDWPWVIFRYQVLG